MYLNTYFQVLKNTTRIFSCILTHTCLQKIKNSYLNPRSKQTIKLSIVPAKQLQQAHDFISVSTQMRL